MSSIFKKNWLLGIFVGVNLLLASVAFYLFFSFFLPSPRDFFRPKVKVTSDIKNLSISFTNPSLLNGYLQSFSFWQKDRIALLGEFLNQPQGYRSVNRLVIHFTDKVQPFDQFRDPQTKNIFQSFGQTYQKGTLNLYLYVLSNPDLEKYSRHTESLLLHSLYLVSHYGEPELKRRQAIQTLLEDYFRSQKKILEIKKI